jgi:hypothetical protein
MHGALYAVIPILIPPANPQSPPSGVRRGWRTACEKELDSLKEEDATVGLSKPFLILFGPCTSLLEPICASL